MAATAAVRNCVFLALLFVPVTARPAEPQPPESSPLSDTYRTRLADSLEKGIARATKSIESDPDQVNGWSARGDLLFQKGRFAEAVADYDKMVALNPDLDASHWRRGIAWFYAGKFKEAAGQFERYHSFDDVDRENGIWRFFSQARAYGLGKAREGLLKYKKDDREPFPAVYQLFAGKTTPEAILKDIREAKIDDDEREKRLFYSQLYIGLNYVIEDQPDKARVHLREAVANRWGPKAGYGPAWMWHVGRVQYDLLLEAERAKAAKP